MSDFKDKVVMVTGAAGNLGNATARAFLAKGAYVVLVDLDLERLEETFADVAQDETVVFAGVDLTDDGAVEGMVYEAVQQLGAVDVLANIAGGFRSGAPVHETSLDTWDFMLDLNARTVLITARAVVPHMLQKGTGKIISVAARPGLKAGATSAAYAASKSAVIRLTESMSASLKESVINVNCVIPGTLDTPQNRKAMPNAKFEKWVAPEALADVITFLASEKARAIHGACVPAYGLT